MFSMCWQRSLSESQSGNKQNVMWCDRLSNSADPDKHAPLTHRTADSKDQELKPQFCNRIIWYSSHSLYCVLYFLCITWSQWLFPPHHHHLHQHCGADYERRQVAAEPGRARIVLYSLLGVAPLPALPQAADKTHPAARGPARSAHSRRTQRRHTAGMERAEVSVLRPLEPGAAVFVRACVYVCVCLSTEVRRCVHHHHPHSPSSQWLSHLKWAAKERLSAQLHGPSAHRFKKKKNRWKSFQAKGLIVRMDCNNKLYYNFILFIHFKP